jgi:hypothetical protein
MITDPNLVSSLTEVQVSGVIMPIEEGDRQEVRAILAAVSRQLLTVPVPPRVARTRLEMVVACLIEVVDALDGDADLEDGHDTEIICEDEGAQCDDEGVDTDLEPDDPHSIAGGAGA